MAEHPARDPSSDAAPAALAALPGGGASVGLEASDPVLLTGNVRQHARRAHVGVLVFYAIDALLLLAYAAAGAVSPRVGLLYGAAGIGLTAAFSLGFWRRGGRVGEVQRLTVLQTALAAFMMLATLVGAPQVGGLMLMSLMAVLSLTAISLRGRAMLWLCLAVSGALVAVLGLTAVRPGFPAGSAAERGLTGLWLSLLMLKATVQNLTGRHLRLLIDQSNTRLAQALREVEKLAATDELTALPNRRSILRQLQRAIDRGGEAGDGPAVALVDIDFFKRINDRFGHELGDHVLQRFGEVVSAALRPVDAVGRYGGEEFLLVLGHPPGLATAGEIAERVRQRIAAHDWSGLAPGLAITASIGVANVRPEDDASAAIRRADAALYGAKHLGRNRVLLASAEDGV